MWSIFKSSIKELALTLGRYGDVIALRRLLSRRQHREFVELKALYASLIPAGELCFDVGANVGVNTEAMLACGLHVVAVEPQVDCIRELRQRCCSQPGNLTVVQGGLGAKAGRATLYLRERTTQASFHSEWEGEPDGQIEVPIFTHDALVKDHGKPYYCKIDTEGSESSVLEGMSEVPELLSFEYHFGRDRWDEAVAIIRTLQTKGFTQANLISSRSAALAYPQWQPIATFAERVWADYADAPNFGYGDIFVKG